MFDLHIQGGIEYMVPLTLLLLINVGLIGFVLIKVIQMKEHSSRWLEWIRQIGGLALAWGVFSTVLGLFQAFNSLAEINDTLPLHIIMGGLAVALITAAYGLIIFIISMLAYIGLKMVERKSKIVA